MSPPRWPLPALAAVLLASSAGGASAQTTVRDRAQFVATFNRTAGDPLDGVDASLLPTTTTDLAFGALTTGVLSAPTPDAPPGRYLGPSPRGGATNNSWTVAFGGVTRLTFSSAVQGFGATFLGLGSLDDVDFNFYRLGTPVVPVGSVFFALQPTGELFDGFFGVALGLDFDMVEIVATTDNGGEYFDMDDLLVGDTVVPEPSTLGLVAAGLAGAAAATAARRRGHLAPSASEPARG